MDFEHLHRIDRMFTHRWDAFVIGSLGVADGPLRFNQLAQAVGDHAGFRIMDSTLTRIKDRLIRFGLIVVTEDHDGHKAYALTATGRRQATILQLITEALDRLTNAAGDMADQRSDDK